MEAVILIDSLLGGILISMIKTLKCGVFLSDNDKKKN
jgi:hypothetical protein